MRGQAWGEEDVEFIWINHVFITTNIQDVS